LSARRTARPPARDLRGQAGGDSRRLVGAGVVGDGDQAREREAIAEIAAQSPDAGLEGTFLVEHRHDDLDLGRRARLGAGAIVSIDVMGHSPGPKSGLCAPWVEAESSAAAVSPVSSVSPPTTVPA
jgi:hypothetical protein